MALAKYKVPFRQVYTVTLLDLIRETLWCHFVIRVFPGAVDLRSDPLADLYAESPEKMYEQYRSWFGHSSSSERPAIEAI